MPPTCFPGYLKTGGAVRHCFLHNCILNDTQGQIRYHSLVEYDDQFMNNVKKKHITQRFVTLTLSTVTPTLCHP